MHPSLNAIVNNSAPDHTGSMRPLPCTESVPLIGIKLWETTHILKSIGIVRNAANDGKRGGRAGPDIQYIASIDVTDLPEIRPFGVTKQCNRHPAHRTQ